MCLLIRSLQLQRQDPRSKFVTPTSNKMQVAVRSKAAGLPLLWVAIPCGVQNHHVFQQEQSYCFKIGMYMYICLLILRFGMFLDYYVKAQAYIANGLHPALKHSSVDSCARPKCNCQAYSLQGIPNHHWKLVQTMVVIIVILVLQIFWHPTGSVA